jgi:hypothetical protein
MTDGLSVAALLLVLGPAAGAVGHYNPALYPAWTAPRDRHLALVRMHPRAWLAANAGFVVATVVTAAGLVVFAGAVDIREDLRAIAVACAVVYAIAGVLWCAVVAIRTRADPALAEMTVTGTPIEPAETLLGAATGALFATFVLLTGAALVVLGLALAFGGGIAAPIAWLAALIAALVVAGFVISGDSIPAILYCPTLIIGLALLAGWS